MASKLIMADDTRYGSFYPIVMITQLNIKQRSILYSANKTLLVI